MKTVFVDDDGSGDGVILRFLFPAQLRGPDGQALPWQEILDEIEVDVDDLLSHFVGDAVARYLSRAR